jgi:DNA-binding transcriptional regulator YhcF (GntR family)
MAGYREIAKELVDQIDKQVLRAGDRVPSIRRAALKHRVNPGTVVRAYGELEARGLIESRLLCPQYPPQATATTDAVQGRTPTRCS